MNKILIYFFIAVGLSMDAFSLALAYGTNGLKLNKIIKLSTIVGLFHFIMPKLGGLIGLSLFESFISKANILVGIVFLVLAIEMFLSRDEEEKVNITNYLSMIFFAFTVSLDSFSVGIALSLTEKTITNACLIFSIVSFLFTFSSLSLGEKLNEKLGKKSTYIGIIILLLLSLKYFL